MPTRALSMRKIRELIRLKYQAGLSHEQIAGALAISKGVVAKYVGRIERAGLEPGELLVLSDAEVLARIAPAPRSSHYGGRIAPDFAHVHAELKRPSVTLMLLWQEYTSANADGRTYRYSQFTDLYRDYVATLRRSMRATYLATTPLEIDNAPAICSCERRASYFSRISSRILRMLSALVGIDPLRYQNRQGYPLSTSAADRPDRPPASVPTDP